MFWRIGLWPRGTTTERAGDSEAHTKISRLLAMDFMVRFRVLPEPKISDIVVAPFSRSCFQQIFVDLCPYPHPSPLRGSQKRENKLRCLDEGRRWHF